MAADHSHSHDVSLAPATRRALIWAVIAVGGLVVVGMLLIGFGTNAESAVENVLLDTTYEAKVTEVRSGPCPGTEPEDGVPCELVTVRLTQGPDDGETRTLSFSIDAPGNPDLGNGDRIVVSYTKGAEPGFEYNFADRQRRPVLFAAGVVFALAVVLLGRARGLAALGGVVVSIAVILQFVLPGILEGHDPLIVAVLGSAAIAYVALYLAHGFNTLTTVALLGTLASLALTVILAATFTALARFSGYASEEALVLGSLAADVDINGLVLAGIVIGALGALDDVTVTQASAVAELRNANPMMSRVQLYIAAVRIGRDHIASTVNTLALAYAGAALPIMLLFVLSKQSLGTVANSEVIATEIIRTLVGSIGLVASVPVTTWLATRVVVGRDAAPPEKRQRWRRAPRSPRTSRSDSTHPGERSFWS
ncbi:MAG: YibE/F family protein [Actinomycetota bacterium]